MKLRVETGEVVRAAALMNGAGHRWTEGLERLGFKYGTRFVNRIQRTYRTGGTNATATAVRTGRLRRSASFAVDKRGNAAIDIRAGYMKPSADSEVLSYAATQEFGAIIKAKPGKFLAIPLKAAKTPAGVPRGGPRDFENTFIRKGVIFHQLGANQIVPLFALKKEVTVPARPSIRPTMEYFAPEVAREGLETLRTAILGGEAA